MVGGAAGRRRGGRGLGRRRVVAIGALALTANWGPVRWFADWSMGRAHRELWGGDPPHEATPP